MFFQRRRIKIRDVDDCILARLFYTYGDGLLATRISPSNAIQFGFNCYRRDEPYIVKCWEREVQSRLNNRRSA
jgi:hypothetical protein